MHPLSSILDPIFVTWGRRVGTSNNAPIKGGSEIWREFKYLSNKRHHVQENQRLHWQPFGPEEKQECQLLPPF